MLTPRTLLRLLLASYRYEIILSSHLNSDIHVVKTQGITGALGPVSGTSSLTAELDVLLGSLNTVLGLLTSLLGAISGVLALVSSL